MSKTVLKVTKAAERLGLEHEAIQSRGFWYFTFKHPSTHDTYGAFKGRRLAEAWLNGYGIGFRFCSGNGK